VTADTAEQVQHIWCEVLNRAQAQPGDWFFEVGGTSVTAVRFIEALQERLAVSLPYEVLFLDGELATVQRECVRLRGRRDGLTDLVGATVTREPEAVALEAGDRSLTYAELWRRAGSVAARLAGDTPASRRVGLLATRDIETYVGYLGILRAGRVVVPINREAPAARVATMLTAAGAGTVVAAPGHGPGPGCRLVTVGAEAAGPTEAAEPANPAGGDDEAYLLFTSGSTGVPKGVPIPHRAAVSYIRHIVERYSLGLGCRLSQTFELTFDPSVFDVFGAWASGATVVVPGPRDLLMPVRYVNDRKITHWFSVPSVVSLASRVGALPPDAMPGLTFSGFIGEPLTLVQAAAWRAAAPRSSIENLYGPTELTVSCAEYTLPGNVDQWPRTRNGTVPIGEIFAELEALVVDADGLPAETGELLVRGSQRFDGYLDPQDNHGRFASPAGDGVSPYTGERPLAPADWYRTGDRVRREHGSLVHLGRLDRQVKVRGFRIELGEIEHVIRSVEGVSDAVVIAPEDETGQLRSFFTGCGDTRDEIRRLIAERLPPYMVPAEITWIEQMPLNPNGKIDHRALRAR
jgi:amino acid adenylation domain-containing protein